MAGHDEAGRAGASGGADVRVQYRLDLAEGPTGFGDDAATRVGVAVDVETTGTVPETGAIIELAMRRFRFDAEGVITHLDRSYCWREDPGSPIPPDITRMTGIADDDVAGRRIDDEAALRVLRSASIVVAHNAAFDRPWIEGRLDDAGDLEWACSMSQIDWRGHGFDGLALGHLLGQAGWFHEAHRGPADVDAVIQLLRHRFGDGTTALAQLLQRAADPSWIVRAAGASFEVKDLLRDRSYRWDAGRRSWWKEVDDLSRSAEEFWLASSVYAAGRGARAMGPDFEKVTARTRFR
ncbi:3'-5' exonuclease [Sphingomonas sp. CFBP 13733]|uniref:3'-5' exonuclease n=1 Tax=Sphingomonas sp. CFBP 13733 TaxID=2775291 RepID=UPI00177E08E0|nr:3'-5' exonuclease [Sphingomonas sp. CFBP 13733]MBD8640258.1 DNA polymerase III subunit epsilon [Sphingomonas sp. CFBP 13733]